MKIVAIVAICPQFIKAAPVSRAIRDRVGKDGGERMVCIGGDGCWNLLKAYEQAANTLPENRPNLYGDGKAGQDMVLYLLEKSKLLHLVTSI